MPRGVTTERRRTTGEVRNNSKTNREGMGRVMKRFFAAIMSVAVVAAMAPVANAQSQCPAEVSQAQAMLKKVSKAQDVQAPRSLAGSRQDIQAPRAGQDVQAPRSGQDIQAPRSGQDIQAPRSLAGAKSSSGSDAMKLVREAEAACKAGNMDTAKAKAVEAMGLMK